MSKVPFSTRWLLAGLLFLALWLTAGTAYGQSAALLDAANQGRTLYGQGKVCVGRTPHADPGGRQIYLEGKVCRLNET